MVLIVLAILIIGLVVTGTLLVKRGQLTTQSPPGTSSDPSRPGTPVP